VRHLVFEVSIEQAQSGLSTHCRQGGGCALFASRRKKGRQTGLIEPASEKTIRLDIEKMLTAEEIVINNYFVFTKAALTHHFAQLLQMGTSMCALTLCSRRWRPL
jgi:hypothetical protein